MSRGKIVVVLCVLFLLSSCRSLWPTKYHFELRKDKYEPYVMKLVKYRSS